MWVSDQKIYRMRLMPRQTPLIVRTGSRIFHAYYRHNHERRRIRPWGKFLLRRRP